MKKNQIRLTEQDLHYIVENAVAQVLVENGYDEGLLGGLGALGKKAWNGMTKAGSNMANQVGNAIGGVANKVGNAVGGMANKVGDAVGGAYNDMKNTYQTGSANQDAQKYINNAVKALNQLKQVDQKLQSMGQASVIGRQTQLIDQLISALNQGGAASISGRFKNRRSAVTN